MKKGYSLFDSLKSNCSVMTSEDCHYFSKNVLAFCVIYFIALFSLLRANVSYIDDLAVTVQGYRGWGRFGRYITQCFSAIEHGNGTLADMSPLSQMLAILIVAVSSAIILHIFVKSRRFSIIHIVTLLPIGLSPYFLECFSYKIDSPYMALSVLGSVFPFLFTNNLTYFFLASVLGLMIMCTTYQAGSGIYCLVGMFYCLRRWQEGETVRNLLPLVSTGVLAFVLSLLSYKFFIVKPFDDYVSSEIGKQGIVNNLVRNGETYLGLLLNDANKVWKYCFAIVVGMSVINFVVTSKKNRIISLTCYIISLVIGLYLSYGVYLILGKPLFAPRAMYGFGVYASMISLVGVLCWDKNFLMKISCCYFSWLLLGYSALYGNALAENKRYAEFRIQVLMSDLNTLSLTDVKKSAIVVLHGNPQYSPVVEKWYSLYPVLRREALSQFGGGWYWHKAFFGNYYNLPNLTFRWSGLEGNELVMWKNMPLSIDHRYHAIRSDGEKVLVELK